MSEKKPTAEEWKKLYAAAAKVKEMAPWEWMMEDEVFGVQNPETDEIGFVSVMGAGGEHFAIALYPGAGALYDFLTLHNEGEEGIDDGAVAERVLEIPQLQASFEDRDSLQKEDRDVIKKLNLKFRGANNWPLFRSYAPAMFPWFITSSEAGFLTAALNQLIDVAPRVRNDEGILWGEEDDDFLVRVPRKEKGRVVWEDRILRAPEPVEKEVTPARPDTQLLESLKSLPKKGMAFELDLKMMPMPVREKKERPFFPYLLMIVEAQSGLVLSVDTIEPQPSLDEMRASLPLRLASAMSQMGVIPQVISVRTETIAQLLAPLAEELGIQIKLSPRMPALDAALGFLERMSPFG
jgi:hypothetical protein